MLGEMFFNILVTSYFLLVFVCYIVLSVCVGNLLAFFIPQVVALCIQALIAVWLGHRFANLIIEWQNFKYGSGSNHDAIIKKVLIDTGKWDW
jgi:hypothetical protein